MTTRKQACGPSKALSVTSRGRLTPIPHHLLPRYAIICHLTSPPCPVPDKVLSAPCHP